LARMTRAGKHRQQANPIGCRGLTEILDQIGGQNQSDVAIDRSRQRWEQFLPVLFRSGRKGPVATN